MTTMTRTLDRLLRMTDLEIAMARAQADAESDMPRSGRSEPRCGPVAHHATWTRYDDRIQMACLCPWAPVFEPRYDDEAMERLACMHDGRDAA